MLLRDLYDWNQGLSDIEAEKSMEKERTKDSERAKGLAVRNAALGGMCEWY